MFRSASLVARMAAVASARQLSRTTTIARFVQPSFTSLQLLVTPQSQTRHYSAKAPLTKKTVEERIILVLSCYDKIDAKKLTMDSDFSKDLGLDSLDHVEVVMALEEEFGFEIPDGDADNFKTPKHVWQYICDKEDVYE